MEFHIDLSEVFASVEEARPDVAALQEGLKNAAEFVRNVWIGAVSGSVLPGMTRAVNDDDYKRALSDAQSMRFASPFQVVIMPTSHLDAVKRIEDGYSQFDMKPGLLNGPKSRQTKDGKGRYNVVPFRHMTPPSNGQSAMSIKMQMPANIYKMAKKLTISKTATRLDGTLTTKWGESLRSPPSFNGSDFGNYEGMYRVGDAHHTRYLTFRRVSTWRNVDGVQKGSPPSSWIHPGLAPNPVMQAVYDFCMPEIERRLLEIAVRSIE